jgi:hypothetical protein
LAGVVIGLVAAAGGCGSEKSGGQIDISKERQAIREANKQKISEEKQLEREERAKHPQVNKKGGPAR